MNWDSPNKQMNQSPFALIKNISPSHNTCYIIPYKINLNNYEISSKFDMKKRKA